jgi:hypothetical protein
MGNYNRSSIGFAPKIFQQSFEEGNNQSVDLGGEGKVRVWGYTFSIVSGAVSTAQLLYDGNNIGHLDAAAERFHVISIPFIADKAFTVNNDITNGIISVTILYSQEGT